MVAADDNPPANTEPSDPNAQADDVNLRGVPGGLPGPAELAERHPSAPFLIAYSRISDDWRQHSKKKSAKSPWKPGKGVANQHRRNEMNASHYGCLIVRRYTDNDLTAAHRSVARPDFEQMLRDLRRGYTLEGYRVDGVICVDQDRLQRTDNDWERFADALASVPDRRLWTSSGPSDLADRRDVIKTGFMAAVNKAESQKQSRRIRDWHQDRILDGLPHSGPRPFGWDDNRLDLRPAEADFLRWAIHERLKGRSMRALCAEAERRGLTGTKNVRFVPQTLTQVMTAPRVCGFRANRGDLVVDRYGEPIVGIWAPIVTPEEWRAVCATFAAGSTYLARGAGTPRITGVPKTIKYLASGLLRCNATFPGGKVCNARMGGSRTNRSMSSPYVYRCPPGRGCGNNAISGPMTDDALEGLVLVKLSEMQATYTPPQQSWPLEATLAGLRQKLRGLEECCRNPGPDGICDEQHHHNAPRLEREISELHRDRARWEQEYAEENEPPGDISRKWRSGAYDLAQKRKVLFRVFTAVLVDRGQKGSRPANPGRLHPVWNTKALPGR